jgi:hypothetical protein
VSLGAPFALRGESRQLNLEDVPWPDSGVCTGKAQQNVDPQKTGLEPDRQEHHLPEFHALKVHAEG